MMDVFRMAVDAVGSVMSGIGNVISQLEDGAISPMTQMNNQVQGGEWIGQGADQFVSDVQSTMIPGVSQITGMLGGFNGNLSGAINIMQEADGVVNQIVNAVGDVFDAIF